jgi:YesN/AraC family two-component response regulator
MLQTIMILGSHQLLEQLKSLTVIYVEDDMLTRTLMKTALETMVEKVYLAKDGEEGLKLYKAISPHIVLTDMHMPKMNGLEMAEKIKELKPTQAIAMFTGDSDDIIYSDTSPHPVDIYLSKPLNRKQFYDALKSLAQLLH